MSPTGFTRTKVGSRTLGEKLQDIRNEFRIPLAEVARQTGIQQKYLEYLERGEYERLPFDVYVRGFVRSYARFLGADESVLLRLYDKERRIRANLKKEEFAPKERQPFRLPSFVLTPRALAVSGAVLLTMGAFFYLYREYRQFTAAPQLVILEPENGVIVPGPSVIVRGRTDPDATLLINRQPVLVEENGDFAEEVRLSPGLNTLSITTINKFDKERSETVTVQMAEPEPVLAEPAPVEPAPAVQPEVAPPVAPNGQDPAPAPSR